MPIGGFLEQFPSIMFVVAHVAFLLVGLWAVKKATDDKASYAWAFWLYVGSQIFFLCFFGGILTMKMAVLLEQTLIVIMVLWVATRSKLKMT